MSENLGGCYTDQKKNERFIGRKSKLLINKKRQAVSLAYLVIAFSLKQHYQVLIYLCFLL